MSHYCHLTIFERECLWEMHLKGESLQKIAKTLGRSASTISRELKRNKKQDNYSPTIAQAKYRERRKKCVVKSNQKHPRALPFEPTTVKRIYHQRYLIFYQISKF